MSATHRGSRVWRSGWMRFVANSERHVYRCSCLGDAPSPGFVLLRGQPRRSPEVTHTKEYLRKSRTPRNISGDSNDKAKRRVEQVFDRGQTGPDKA